MRGLIEEQKGVEVEETRWNPLARNAKALNALRVYNDEVCSGCSTVYPGNRMLQGDSDGAYNPFR